MFRRYLEGTSSFSCLSHKSTDARTSSDRVMPRSAAAWSRTATCAGFILTTTDLANLADAAGVALRAGERRYALKALLAQDAAATLTGLAELAAAPPALEGVIGAHWRQRSRRTSRLLSRLAAAAL